MRFWIWPVLIYYTLIRHELCHALGAKLLGGKINEIRVLPGYNDELGFFWGYVSYSMDPHWFVKALPFLVDLFSLVLGYLLIRKFATTWTQITVRLAALFLILSPIFDLVYNYQSIFWRESADSYELAEMISPVVVHLFFLVSIALAIYFWRQVREF